MMSTHDGHPDCVCNDGRAHERDVCECCETINWTERAERAVAAVRAVDPTDALLVELCQWLEARKAGRLEL